MYLRQTPNKKTGRIYLSIVHGYRDSEGKVKQKTIQKIGYLDEFEKDFDDPIAHFKKVAKNMEQERKEEKNITITFDMDDQLERNNKNRKNYGYIVFSKIYHELGIDVFLKNARRHKNFKFNTDAIMRLLVYSRLLFPASKRTTVINKDIFFDNFKFSLDDVYDALTHFDEICLGMQKHLHAKVTEQYGRETDLVYYDVTNYYFEIDKQDELRKKGFSKEHRTDPIVQMGLLLDKLGLPIAYKLFPGNTHDSQTLLPILKDVKKELGVRRIISVADKGINCGDNIAFSTVLGDGYIYSKSVRGASEEFKKWVLDETGYRKLSDKYKIKSMLVPDAKINVSVEQIGKRKKTKKEKVEQKWVAFYSEKYAIRAKHKRDETIAKAISMIENPAKYKKAFDYGAAGYIKNLKIDKDTGEVLNLKSNLSLDIQKIEEEEKYDGYYALVTSEMDDSDEHIIEMYRGLWRIEESFKVTKSVLETRPIYLRTSEHINAHFLTCFIALLIGRITEMRLGRKYNIAKITETLREVSCTNEEQNIWLFNFADEVTDEFNNTFGTNFGLKRMTLKEIKNNFARTKK